MLVWANSNPWKRACVVAELVSQDLHSDHPSLGRTRASFPVAAAGAVDSFPSSMSCQWCQFFLGKGEFSPWGSKQKVGLAFCWPGQRVQLSHGLWSLVVSHATQTKTWPSVGVWAWPWLTLQNTRLRCPCGNMAFVIQHGLRWQPRPRACLWPSVRT